MLWRFLRYSRPLLFFHRYGYFNGLVCVCVCTCAFCLTIFSKSRYVKCASFSWSEENHFGLRLTIEWSYLRTATRWEKQWKKKEISLEFPIGTTRRWQQKVRIEKYTKDGKWKLNESEFSFFPSKSSFFYGFFVIIILFSLAIETMFIILQQRNGKKKNEFQVFHFRWWLLL